MNSAKSAVKSMNSSKNKLNSEIILIYNSLPNARLGSVWIPLILLKTENLLLKTL